jgi:hypothetical protein
LGRPERVTAEIRVYPGKKSEKRRFLPEQACDQGRQPARKRSDTREGLGKPREQLELRFQGVIPFFPLQVWKLLLYQWIQFDKLTYATGFLLAPRR